MLAYNGISAGRRMESSINNKSLITGNVSTEESRNEIRKSPGAPSPPANATIFCFHAPSFEDNEIPPSKNRVLPSRKNGGRHQLLRKRGAIEVTHEDLHQRGSMEIGQPRNLADHPHVPEALDRFPVLAVLVPDQH